jgi:hypothetical protein
VSAPWNPGPGAPPPRQRVAPTSTRSRPKRASSRRSSQRSKARCDPCVPPSLGKPPFAASACASWANRPANASTSTSMLTTRTRRRARARSSLQPQRYYGPCPHYHRPKPGTCTARRRRSTSKRPFNRPRARCPASASQAVCGTTATPREGRRLSMRMARQGNRPTRAERRSGSESLTRASKPRTATPATSSTPAGRATRRRGRR